MDFAQAMERVLDYRKVRRYNWNSPKYIYTEVIIDTLHVKQIVMEMKDGTKNSYVPSQCDMLAHDWSEVYNG